MSSFHQQLIISLVLCCLMISIVHSFRITELEHAIHDNDLVNEQAIADAARLRAWNQVLTRRSLYDPAFGDSWSNYLEKKRSLFDPAYSDWANSFKRSNE